MSARGGSQYVGPDGLTHYQRNKEVYKERAKARKRYIQQYLMRVKALKKCADCGFSDPRALDFDHLGDKTMNVTDMAYGKGWGLERIKQEIRKCEVVCANCHRIRTAMRR